MTITTRDHYLVRHSYPGSYGDRPQPWEISYTCACGAGILELSEDQGDPVISLDEAMDEHLEEVEQ